MKKHRCGLLPAELFAIEDVPRTEIDALQNSGELLGNGTNSRGRSRTIRE